jgi:hypothetical protein
MGSSSGFDELSLGVEKSSLSCGLNLPESLV